MKLLSQNLIDDQATYGKALDALAFHLSCEANGITAQERATNKHKLYKFISNTIPSLLDAMLTDLYGSSIAQKVTQLGYVPEASAVQLAKEMSDVARYRGALNLLTITDNLKYDSFVALGDEFAEVFPNVQRKRPPFNHDARRRCFGPGRRISGHVISLLSNTAVCLSLSLGSVIALAKGPFLIKLISAGLLVPVTKTATNVSRDWVAITRAMHAGGVSPLVVASALLFAGYSEQVEVLCASGRTLSSWHPQLAVASLSSPLANPYLYDGDVKIETANGPLSGLVFSVDYERLTWTQRFLCCTLVDAGALVLTQRSHRFITNEVLDDI